MAAGLRRRGEGPTLTRVCAAVDATTVKEPGPTGSLWRVHWSVNLATLECAFFEVTDVHGGEKFARFPIAPGQLVMGDRGYSTPAGIDSIRQRGGHVLVRANPMSLPLYALKGGRRMNVLARVRGMKVGQVRAWPAWVQGPEERWHRGRLVVVKRSLASTRRELRHRRKISSSQDRQLGPRGRALARYVLIWTSLPAAELSAKRVLGYYRLRWQLELVFKRAKSIMGLGQLPKHSDASSRAWLNGKLLVAMLVEKLWRDAERFSPWGYALGRSPQPLA
jgi:IS4 transposase